MRNRSIIYIYYPTMVKIMPSLYWIFAWIFNKSNRKIVFHREKVNGFITGDKAFLFFVKNRSF